MKEQNEEKKNTTTLSTGESVLFSMTTARMFLEDETQYAYLGMNEEGAHVWGDKAHTIKEGDYVVFHHLNKEDEDFEGRGLVLDAAPHWRDESKVVITIDDDKYGEGCYVLPDEKIRIASITRIPPFWEKYKSAQASLAREKAFMIFFMANAGCEFPKVEWFSVYGTWVSIHIPRCIKTLRQLRKFLGKKWKQRPRDKDYPNQIIYDLKDPHEEDYRFYNWIHIEVKIMDPIISDVTKEDLQNVCTKFPVKTYEVVQEKTDYGQVCFKADGTPDLKGMTIEERVAFRLWYEDLAETRADREEQEE